MTLRRALVGLVLAAGLSITGVQAATATGTPPPNTNEVAYWCADGHGFKYDGLTTTGFVVPAPPTGWHWTLLVLKAGSDVSVPTGENETFVNPVVGQTYYHSSGKTLSHAILCKAPDGTTTTYHVTTTTGASTTYASTTAASTTIATTTSGVTTTTCADCVPDTQGTTTTGATTTAGTTTVATTIATTTTGATTTAATTTVPGSTTTGGTTTTTNVGICCLQGTTTTVASTTTTAASTTTTAPAATTTVAAPTTTAPTAAPVTTVPTELPHTGSESWTFAAVAFALMLAGWALDSVKALARR